MARNKYHAKKTIVDNITFASKKEAKMYIKLKAMETEGEIERLQLQPQFELQPGFRGKSGKKYRAINYTADFAFQDLREDEERYRVIDCKGYKTRDYMLRKKMFAYAFRDAGLEIEEEV